MKICIVGGGIIGLSTGLYLKRQNRAFDVTIISDKVTPETTADGAAGIWGIYLIKDTPKEQQKQWAQETHDFIEDLWLSENGGLMGISLVSSTRFNHDPILAEVWKDIVYGFRELTAQELASYGRLTGTHSHGYQFMTYTIEPVKLLPWFMADFLRLGGKVIPNQKVKDLGQAGHDYNADLIINCTGAWASALTGDKEIAALRGQVMRVKAPWIKDVILDDREDGNYIISNQDSVVFGGTHDFDNWDLAPSAQDRKFIWAGCKALAPHAVAKASHIKDWVGLRPGRNAVRLERDTCAYGGKTYPLIHNYGHGGSGITIFWGCAKEVYDLVCDIQPGKATKSML